MSNIMEILIKATDQATGTLQKVSAEFDKAAEKPKLIGDNMAKAMEKTGIAMAAVGVGIEALARKQVELSTSTDQIAIAYGTTADVISDMAIRVNGAGDSISETLGIIKVGVQQGLDGEALENYADYWDTVADAVGGSGPALAEAGLALTQLGVDAANMEQETSAAFGYLSTNSTASIDDFLSVIAKTGPSLKTMGVDVNEAAVLVGEMADQGVPAKLIISEINKAASETGGIDNLCAKYGITKEELKQVTDNSDQYSQSLADQAAAVEHNLTPLQTIQTYLEETAYKYRDVVAGAAQFAPALMDGGAVLAGMPTLVNGYSKAMDLLGTGLKSVGAMAPGTVASLGTVGPAITGIMIPWGAVAIAAIALFAVAWKTNFLGIRDVVAGAKDFISDRFSAMKDAAAKMGDALKPSFDALKKAGGELKNSLGELFQKLSGGVSATEMFAKAWEVVGRVLDTMISLFGKLATAGVKALVDQLTSLVDWIGKVVDWFSKLADNPVVQYFLDFKEGVEGAASSLLDRFIPAADKTEDGMEDATTAVDKTTGAFSTLDKEGSTSAANLATNVGKAMSDTATSLGGVGGAISKLLDDLDAARQKQFDTALEISNMTPQQRETALTSKKLSEADTMAIFVSDIKKYATEHDITYDAAEKKALSSSDYATYSQLKDKVKELEKTGQYLSYTSPVSSGSGSGGSGSGSSTTTTTPTGFTGKWYNGDGTWSNAPPATITGDWQNAPDYEGMISTWSGVKEATPSPSGHDTSTEAPLYITQQTGADGKTYNQAYYADNREDSGVYGTTILAQDIAKWIREGIGLYQYDGTNGMGGYKGEEITDALKDQTKATEQATTANEVSTTVLKASANAIDSATKATTTVTKATNTLATTLGLTSSATQRSESYISNWHTAVVDNSRVSDVLVREASDRMTNSVIERNATTASNVYATHEIIGRTTTGSADTIYRTMDGMFRNIISRAKTAAEEVAGAAASCVGGSCGGIDTSTGGAGSPIVYNGTSTYPGATIDTSYRVATSIRSTGSTTFTPGISFRTVPAMAAGGDVVEGGDVVVGDNGAELVHLPSGARVTPLRSGEDDLVDKIARKILAKIGSSQGRSGDVHLHGVFIANQSGIRELNREIEKVKVLEDARRGRGVTG